MMKEREVTSTKKLVMLAFFVALFVVLERFLSFNAWNMRIGFAFVALVMAGMLYGPVAAGLTGALGDILGMLIFPTGPYFPGFTLNAFLTGFVFGFFLHDRVTPPRVVASVAINQLILSLFLQTLWISITYGSPYYPLLFVRIIQCLVMIPVQLVVIFLLKPSLSRMARQFA